ncbi:MAG: NAD(P)-dependent malic enzyme [Candidatus Porifericomitaceae bacterium WSBS_2022_MAG_OTU9]
MNYFKKSLVLHEQLRGKIRITSKAPIESVDDLSIWYTPGVAAPCEAIAKDPGRARHMTIKHNSVAVVTDGTAVLGLGDIGPKAAIPVMEGKCMLFRQLAGIDAWPLCLDTTDSEQIISVIRAIAPVFGGINLEDISAPRCFEIESRLQDLDIPVFHDDQHGTAIVLTAALMNACRLLNRKLGMLTIVINGAGAAGTAIAKLLSSKLLHNKLKHGRQAPNIIMCDSKGAISSNRKDLNAYKKALLKFTNKDNRSGTLAQVIKGADVFIGVSKGNVLKAKDVKTMAKGPIIFALANPIPEIMPAEAKKGGAAVIGTGRSDFPNQINNVLVFPGIFRGALDAKATTITEQMKVNAAFALADSVDRLEPDSIIPSPLDKTVVPQVARAVAQGCPSQSSTAVAVKKKKPAKNKLAKAKKVAKKKA